MTPDKEIVALPKQTTSELVTFSPTMVQFNPQAITVAKHNKEIAELLVTSVLEEGWDYGQIEGLEGKSLFDPGAAAIMNAMEAYAEHEVIFHQEDESIISWVIQAKVIHRGSQTVVGTGVGACSTKEPKYKYRWAWRSELVGISPDEIKKLKKHRKLDKYRIVNPEYGELSNTIMTMAAKRAEVDAVKSLPGVGTALRKLFDKKEKRDDQQEGGIEWGKFWGWASSAGIVDRVHTLLEVDSVKTWVTMGHTLEEAKQLILEKLKAETGDSGYVPRPAVTPPVIQDTAKGDFENWGELAQAAANLKPSVTPGEVFARARVKAWTDFSDYYTAWTIVMDIHNEKKSLKK